MLDCIWCTNWEKLVAWTIESDQYDAFDILTILESQNMHGTGCRPPSLFQIRRVIIVAVDDTTKA